jgi:hypothetical protein
MAESCRGVLQQWDCQRYRRAAPVLLDVFENDVAPSALMGQVLLGVERILPTTNPSCIDKDGAVMAPLSSILCTRTPPILLLSKLTRFAPCWVPASQVPVTRAVAERVPVPARSEKFNVS